MSFWGRCHLKDKYMVIVFKGTDGEKSDFKGQRSECQNMDRITLALEQERYNTKNKNLTLTQLPMNNKIPVFCSASLGWAALIYINVRLYKLPASLFEFLLSYET